ncbi:LAFA_0E04038g1_1 [Lachancea sp. 'fantastica']|nr:LAFA_0E04038g1_1 [Lachancea sp. 'fantastica']
MSFQSPRVKSLSELCELSLLRNHLVLRSVRNTPYRLIRNVLMKLKMEQLCKLEETNVLLIFEDDEIWHNLLVKDYPLHADKSFLRKREEIVNYFVSYIEQHDATLLEDVELMKSFLRCAIKKDPELQKYRVPSRMLYFKYQADTVRKQEVSTQRLRSQMQQLQQEKQKNQIAPLDDPLYCEKRTKSGLKNSSRSDLFVKSYKEHQMRQQHFKNGGFDASKRPVKRVAFGGQVGMPASRNGELSAEVTYPSVNKADVPSSKIIRSPTQHASPKRISSPPPARRLQEEPNPFLKRRKPMFRRQNSPSPVPSSGHINEHATKPVVVKVGCKISNKSKKSSIFTAPSPQEQIAKQCGNQSNAYIFDNKSRP